MILRDKVITYLLGQPTVTALTGQRIFPIRAPEGSLYPNLEVTQVSGYDWSSLQGPSGTACVRLQLSCVGRSNFDAQTLAAVLTLPVRSPYNGVWNGLGNTGGTPFSMGGLNIESCYVENETEFDTASRDADDIAKYVVVLDTKITYERA